MTGDGPAATDDWPVELDGVVESVVATRGPDGRWNFAALGLHAGDPATARTWGRTRTWRNFEREGGGVVQFVRDPVVFVESALGVHERDLPVHPASAAWARVEVERIEVGESGDTEWAEWELAPIESTVEHRTVPTMNRGHGAVIEATVAASRLDVSAYDTADLRDRLAFFEEVVETCGGECEHTAMERVRELSAWDGGD